MNETAQYNMSETKGDFKKGGMAFPSITFALGVFGNLLAITWLVLDTYWKQQSSPQRTICSSPQLSLDSRGTTSSLNSKLSVSLKKTSWRRKEKPGHFRKLLLALLSMDLAGTLFISPVTLHVYINGGDITKAGGESLCRYSAFAMMFFGVATMAFLMTMSVERLLNVQFPFYYRSTVTATRAKISIVAVLCSCATFCSLPAAGLITVKPMFPETWCFADWYSKDTKDMVFNVAYASIGIILIFMTVICNIVSVIAIVRLKNRKKNFNPNNCHTESETQNIIQVSVITCIYVICWTPLVIRIFLNSLRNEQNGKLDLTVIRLATAHPILDPWVYILFRKCVWKFLMNTVKCVFFACFPAHVQKKDDADIDATVPLQEIAVNKAKSDACATRDTCINQATSTSTAGERQFSTTLDKTSFIWISLGSLYDNNHD